MCEGEGNKRKLLPLPCATVFDRGNLSSSPGLIPDLVFSLLKINGREQRGSTLMYECSRMSLLDMNLPFLPLSPTG